MRFIGDVHGKFNRYRDIIRHCPASIQVGDMGVGFSRILGDEIEPTANPPFDSMSKGDHRFIRGNHDNPSVCRKHKFWIPDGHVEGDMMFVGGAESIDKERRIEGVSWWRDEQIDFGQTIEFMDRFIDNKPRIMITHDCPWRIYFAIHTYKVYGNPSRTAQFFDELMNWHQPEIWIFGHHHKSFDKVIDGTRFICLAELEYIDLDN